MGQTWQWLPKPPTPSDPVYISHMNKTETNVFFRALHDLEDAHNANVNDPDPEYIEGYDYVMDIVKDAILEGYEVKNLYDLDYFINQADAYGEDNEPGDYADGYQDAVNICLEAVSKLIQSEEV
jgi:hypothetical protein